MFFFFNKELLDIDGVCNFQNERIWTPIHAETDATGDTKEVQKFPKKLMVYLGVCSKEVSPLVIFEEGTVDHDRYIHEIPSVALKF